MRAVSRVGEILLAGAMAFAPAMALAQQSPAPSTNSTATSDTVGAPELRNFSLDGTVTRRAEQPVEVPTTATPRTSRSDSQTDAPAAARTAQAPAPSAGSTGRPAEQPPRSTEVAATRQPQLSTPAANSPEPLRQSAPASSVTVALPKLDGTTQEGSASAKPADLSSFPPAADTGGLAAHGGPSLLPWALAALALALGGAFLFWRNRQRHSFAGGPQIDAFEAPEPVAPLRPAPAPVPVPEAPAPAPPPLPGLVSTRLRPWLEIGFRPLRCILEDERIIVDLELELFNSGSAPARAVLAEASLFNAGPTQDQDIQNFFAKPVGAGERIVAIPPMQRIAVRTQVAAARSHFQPYQLGGREVLVPLIAFNALYSWGGSEGQTSTSYLLGRDTKGEKLGPFPLHLGPRIFRSVAAKALPTSVRR